MPSYTSSDISKLMSFLKRGKHNAIKSDELSKLLGLDPQRTSELIRDLISKAIEQGELIGSNNTGYWIMDSLQEVEEVLGSLERRANSICKRRNHLLNSWNSKNPASGSYRTNVTVKP